PNSFVLTIFGQNRSFYQFSAKFVRFKQISAKIDRFKLF
ncbi:hypothetical protein T09_509, partial [Trichinella sp. T9]